MPDKQAAGMNGGAARPHQVLSGGKLGHFLVTGDPTVNRGTELAGMTTRQYGRGPDAPGGWNRFLLAHLRWILVITLAVVAAAAAYAHHQTPMYKAQTQVNVWFSSPDPAALQGPNMVTEKGIVMSGAVLSIASSSLGVPIPVLQKGLSVNVPASSSILEIGYSDPVPWVARERAQVISEAYVAYRSPKPAPHQAHPQPAEPAGSAVTTLNATLITSATLPTSPSSPNYLVDILAGLIAGLGLGIGTAAIRDHLDDRIRGPFDVEERTGAPALALIPAFRPAWPAPAREPAIIRNPGSVVAEAYRNLRTRLIATAAARGARTLLVTSPSWEKKSVVAANLAVALAQSGRFTVLVCADLRWGTAHELLGVGGGDGLTTVLDRRIDLLRVQRSPGITNLRVVPPGPLPADPAAALQRPALRTILAELRSYADFVIIDAPPVLATSDTAPLAELAEMIMLVGDARKSTRTHLQAAMGELNGAAGKLIGTVLGNAGRYRRLRGRPAGPVTAGPPERDEIGTYHSRPDVTVTSDSP
jgi:polysaccharide biosynthesis transport protein